jgi:hypothetical protein
MYDSFFVGLRLNHFAVNETFTFSTGRDSIEISVSSLVEGVASVLSFCLFSSGEEARTSVFAF